MASPHNQPNPVRSPSPLSFSTEFRRHGRSKAQMCLFKILHIISFFPAADISDKQRLSGDDGSCENRRFDVDLKIGLRAPTKIELFEPPLTAEGGADGKNCVFEKNDRRKSDFFVVEKAELAVEEERATEHSEISHVEDQSSRVDCNGVSEEVEEEKLRDDGYLGLLIEAAQLILGDESKQPSNETKPSRSKYVESSAATVEKGGGKKRRQQCWTAAAEAEWYAEFEDTSPVVKSKRGRSQVLPFKYRDSVVEPLVRWPSSRHRSKSNAAVPSTRRSK